MRCVLLAAALLALGGTGNRRVEAAPQGHPAALVATWFEEGAHAELQLTLRADGRASKALRRQCVERSDQQCIPLKYDGTWSADAKTLAITLPGGMKERYKWSRAGNFLQLIDARGHKSSFVVQLPEAEGKEHPAPLLGAWSEKDRMLTLTADGNYQDQDEDGATQGDWHADREHVTLVPRGGGDLITFGWRVRAGELVLKTASGSTHTFHQVR
jgi:hypothetical protein